MTANPVGVPQQVDKIDTYVQIKIDEWKEAKQENAIRWWQFWKDGTMLHAGVHFITDALDVLIAHAEEAVPRGPDKKATVLAAASILYDYVIREAIPIWMRPFAGKIKQIVIYTIMSSTIDWIVSKYRDGAWNQNEEVKENTIPKTATT